MREAIWKGAGEADGLKAIYYREYEVFGNHTMNHIADEQAIKRFTHEVATWSKQRDAVYQADGTIIIEPENSLAFFEGRKYIMPTRGNAHQYLTPSYPKLLVHQVLGGKYTEYDTLVHFDGFVGRNLYHFFDEAINAQLLLMKCGLVDAAIPLLINEKIYNLKYVQYLIHLPQFKDLTWVVQKKGEWLRVKRLYKAASSNAYFKDTYQMLAKRVKKNPHRKVFLNRTPFFQRRLTNNDAIEAMLTAYGFEVIYAENLTYEQQVQLFAETKYFIALHGAGVTNLLYSDLSQVRVMEIFSESLIHPHFYWFLELLGVHYYDAIVGSSFDINWNYHIDETQFRKQLDLMMQSD